MEEQKENINQLELLFKISNDVASIMSDMKNFQSRYVVDRQNIYDKIEDIRKDSEKELLRQDAQLRQLSVYVEAIRTSRDKEDAKKWRTVIGFILTGLGGILLGCIPAFLKYLVQTGGVQ